jgi:membrane-bound metal-dependent hydrolase YbcI (DUF457 family)
MGDFTEHVIFGLLSAAIVAFLLKGNMALTDMEIIASSIAVVIGSVLPDIDHQNAYVHRAVKAFSAIGAALLSIILLPFPVHVNFVMAAMIFIGVYIGFSKIKMKHRGFTHSIIFTVIVSSLSVVAAVILLSSPVPGIAVGLGIFSHLILDQHISLE